VNSGARQEPRPLGFWLYAGQLWAVFGLALSNILLGLGLLHSLVPARARGSDPGATGRSDSWSAAWSRARPPILALGVYLLFFAVSLLFSLDVETSLRALSVPFNLLPLPLALMLVRGERRVRLLVDGMIVVAAGSALLGLAQFLIGYGGLSHRIRASFSHYMTFSGVLLVADLLLLAQLVSGRGARGWKDAWRWVALVLINVALIGSYTRSAWVGVAVAATLLVLVRAPRWLLAYPVLAALFVLVAPQPVLDRAASIVDLENPSNIDRISMAESGAAMIADHPWTGLGPNMVQEVYPRYRVPMAVRDHVPHLHNSFLQLAAERGLPELGAYLVLMLLAAWTAWRRFLDEGGFEGPRADLYVGMVLALVAFNVAGLFEDNWGDTEVQRYVLFLLAVPWCLDDRPAARPDRLAEPSAAPVDSAP
jgi:O-antigen ligase